MVRPKNPRETRERLLAAADEVFYAHGIRNSSVDEVAQRAGLTKRTLYYHFRSKDDLAAAYVQQRSDLTLARQIGAASSVAGPFAAKVDALFVAVERNATKAGWNGCPFIRTAGEFVDEPRHRAVGHASLHKKSLEAWFQAELVKARYAGHQLLARQLMVLVDGAVAQMLLHRDPAYVQAARQAAAVLLGSARRSAAGSR
jgi:AcrR family transcriptional regulator